VKRSTNIRSTQQLKDGVRWYVVHPPGQWKRRGKLIGQRENVYQHFKFTKRATRSIVIWGALFPAFIAGVAYVYDVRLVCLQLLLSHRFIGGERGS
jgi:hypothetical protein